MTNQSSCTIVIQYIWFMDNEQLVARAFSPLDLKPETHPLFFNAWEEVSYKRGEFLTESGKIERSFYVVRNGVQIIYILTPQGEKRVIGFSFDGSFSGVYDSFLKETPSHYFLEALTDSTLLRMSLKAVSYTHLTLPTIA